MTIKSRNMNHPYNYAFQMHLYDLVMEIIITSFSKTQVTGEHFCETAIPKISPVIQELKSTLDPVLSLRPQS